MQYSFRDVENAIPLHVKHKHLRDASYAEIAALKRGEYITNFMLGTVLTVIFSFVVGGVLWFVVNFFIAMAQGSGAANFSFWAAYFVVLVLGMMLVLMIAGEQSGQLAEKAMDILSRYAAQDNELTAKLEWESQAPERERQAREAAEREKREQEEDRLRVHHQREAKMLRESMKLFSQAEADRKQRATAIGDTVFRSLADFALDRTLKGDQSSPEQIAQQFAAEVLPGMQTQFGAQLGLARETPLAQTAGNAPLLAYLPPAPRFAYSKQGFSADIRDYIELSFQYENRPPDSPTVNIRYVAPGYEHNDYNTQKVREILGV